MTKQVKIKWRKVSGSLMLKNKTVIRTGEEFLAAPDEIPMSFRDTVVPVNPNELPTLENPPPVESEPASYSIVSSGPGRYNVLDGQGKKINEKPLSVADAEQLVESLG